MLIKGCTVFFKRNFHKNLDVGIVGCRIDRVGKDIPPHEGEKVIECDHRNLLIPGFNDSHSHMAAYGIYLTRPRLEGIRSYEELLDKVEETVRDYEKGKIVIFEGFDQSEWDVPKIPERRELDKVAPLNPIILRRVCGHLAVANSLALSLLPSNLKGIDWDRGIMYEWVPLNINRIFPLDFEELKLAVLKAQEEMISLGITSVSEFGDRNSFKVYQELERNRQLKVRVNFNFYERDMIYLNEVGIQTGFGNQRLRLGGIKIFMDGSVGAETAAFFERYRDGRRGRLLMSEKKLAELFEKAEKAQLRLLIHAIGDRAIGRVLKVAASTFVGGNLLRHRIEHAEFILEEQMDAVSKLGLYLSVQPNFVVRWGNPGGLYEERLGAYRGLNSNRIGSLLRKGIKIAFGSDSMPPGPLLGIKGALRHPIEEERIDLLDAIRLYSEAGALLTGEEDQKGKIEEGMLADLVIYEKSPFNNRDVDETFAPSLVIIGGEIVLASGSFKTGR